MKKAILITFLSILIIFIPVLLFNESIYVFVGDGFETYLPFYLGLSRFLTQFWTETITFGSNSFVFMIGYIFSPFLAISGLFQQTTVVKLLWIFDVIRFLLMTVFAYLWLTKVAKRQTTRIIGSIMYTFSGFVLYFLHYSPFYDSYIIIPLILYLVEEVGFANKKKLLFTITIMYAILLNAYFFYIISWMMVFYFITRVLNNGSIREAISSFFSKNTLRLIMYYLIGVGLSGFVLLPVVNIIISNPRLDVDTNLLMHFDIGAKQIYNFISSFYSPVITDYESNIFISKLSFQEARISYHFSLIIFTLIFILNLVEYQRINVNRLVIWIFSYLISFSPLTNLVLNGNPNDIRWHIWLIIINIILSIDVIDNIEKYRKKSIILSFFLNSSIILTIMFLSIKYSLSPSSIVFEQIIIVVFVILISFFYSIIFIFNHKKISAAVLCVLLVMEGMFVLYHRVYEKKQATYIDSSNINLSLIDDMEVLETIQDRDKSFYRIEFVGSMINHPNMLNYPGFTSYLSLYNQNVREYLDGRYSSYWIIDEVPSKWLSKNLLSGKYLVVEKENSEYELPFGFEHYFSTTKYDVYMNKSATDFGFATNKIYAISELKDVDKSIQDTFLMQAIFTDFGTRRIDNADFILPEKLFEEVANHQIVSESTSGFYLIDYQKSWPYTECNIEKYQNDLVTEFYTKYEYSYLTLKNSNQFDRVFLYCHSVYTKNDIIPYTVYYYSEDNLNLLYNQKNNFDQVEMVSKTKNGYQASVTISQPNSVIFLSVPFDESWKIEINGSTHPYENVNGGFIGIKVDDVGNYEIAMRYQPKGLVIGAIISFVSFLLLAFLYIRKYFVLKE